MSQFDFDFSDKFKKMQEQSYLDPSRSVDRPPIALSKGLNRGDIDDPLSICTYGNFSFIQSAPKNGKTFLVSILASAYLKPNKFTGDIQTFRNSGQKLIHYDTEQGDYHAHKVFKRVSDMVGNSDDYMCFALRKYSAKERVAFIDWQLENTPNVGMVIIDGIADLIDDVNDIEKSSKLAQQLMKWTQEKNIHIMTVIHTNYGSEKPTGHLGSFLEKKTETQISIERDEDTNNVLVKCKRSRAISFNDFAFRINPNSIPEVLEELDDTIYGESAGFRFEV
jgi:hypothetical protein